MTKKRIKRLANPKIEPYLPQFKEALNVIRSIASHGAGIENQFMGIAEQIIAIFPSRKQVDALMEMIFVGLLLEIKYIEKHALKSSSRNTEILNLHKKFFDKTDRFLAKYMEKTGDIRPLFSDKLSDQGGLYLSNNLNQVSSFIISLRHYVDTAKALNSPEIIDFDWRNLAQHTLLYNLEERVKIARKKHKKTDNLPKGQTWVKFDDGHEWVYLNTYQSKELAVEGDHCATVESWMGKLNGRLIYLKDKNGNLRLTASYCHIIRLDATLPKDYSKLTEGKDYGIIGQIRGTANTKPKKELRPYITALLCDERVVFHQIDEYAEDDQFKLKDLDVFQIGQIEQFNPIVLNISVLADKKTMDIARAFIKVYDTQQAFKFNKDRVIIWQGDTETFLAETEQKQTLSLWKRLENGEELIRYESADDSEIQNLHSEISNRAEKFLIKAIKAELPDFNPDKDDVLEAIDKTSNVRNAFINSIHIGWDEGTKQEAYQAVLEHIEDMGRNIFGVTGFDLEFKREGQLYGDDSLYLVCDIASLLATIKNDVTFTENSDPIGMSLNFISDKSELRETRNMYEELHKFDDASALDHLEMLLKDLLS